MSLNAQLSREQCFECQMFPRESGAVLAIELPVQEQASLCLAVFWRPDLKRGKHGRMPREFEGSRPRI